MGLLLRHQLRSLGRPAPPAGEADLLSRTAGFDALVERTEGTQPWRRVFHAAGGIAIAWFLGWLAPSRAFAVYTFSLLTALALLTDVVRLVRPEVNAAFFRIFPHLLSPREAAGLASSTWYLLGVLLLAAFFPVPHAVSGILVLALADPAASYVGRRWGRIRMGDGSVEGTAVFIVVALAVLLWASWPWPQAVAGALGGTVVERLPWRIDDNFSLPLGVAVILLASGVLI